MDPRLARLVDLQKSMAEQRRLEREQTEIPSRAAALEQQLAEVDGTLNEAERVFKDHEHQLRQMEMRLQDIQTKEEKIRGQLHQIKTNKEYQAALHEVENFKTMREKTEEEILVLLDTVDEEKERLEQRRGEAAAQESRLRTTLEGLRRRNEEIDGELESAGKLGEEMAAQVDPQLLRQFRRVFDSKEGVALTPANGGFCHSCQVRLTPHVVQVVQRGQDFVICEGCSRFLYWDGDLGD